MPQFLIKDNTLLSHLIRLNIRLRRNYGTYAINAFKKSLLEQFNSYNQNPTIKARENIVNNLFASYIFNHSHNKIISLLNAARIFELSKSYIDYTAIFQKNAYAHGSIYETVIANMIFETKKVSNLDNFMNVIRNNLTLYLVPRPWDLINLLYNDIFNHLMLKTVFK